MNILYYAIISRHYNFMEIPSADQREPEEENSNTNYFAIITFDYTFLENPSARARGLFLD